MKNKIFFFFKKKKVIEKEGQRVDGVVWRTKHDKFNKSKKNAMAGLSREDGREKTNEESHGVRNIVRNTFM